MVKAALFDMQNEICVACIQTRWRTRILAGRKFDMDVDWKVAGVAQRPHGNTAWTEGKCWPSGSLAEGREGVCFLDWDNCQPQGDSLERCGAPA